MRQNIMALCDLETAYAVNFMEYVNRRSGNIPFEIHAFTSVAQLKAFAEKHPVELLLISERAMSEEVEKLPVGQILILTEGLSDAERSVYPAVNKYQPSSLLIREVLEDYAKGKKARSAGALFREKLRVTGILSPASSPASACFALSAGLLMSAKRPTLMIDFDVCSVLTVIARGEGGKKRDLSDVIYYYRQKKENCMDFLNALAEQYESLHYLPPCGQFSDLTDVSGAEWAGVIRLIRAESNFENLLLLLNPSVNGLGEILAECDTVLVPGGEDLISRGKAERFFGLLERDGKKALKGKFHPVALTGEWAEIPRDAQDLSRALLFGQPAGAAERELKAAGCL